MNKYSVEYTDTFAGEANYSWVKRVTIYMPCLTHYGYTGSADGSYTKASKVFNRELVRKAKAEMGLTGVRGRSYWHGESYEFRPYRMATILFINFAESV